MTTTEHLGFDSTSAVPVSALGPYDFAVGYVSHSAWKNMTPEFVREVAAAGKAVVIVWETTADRALDGYDAGVADAKEALRQAKALGMPWGLLRKRPIYFAIDFDVTNQQTRIARYFQGVGSVLGPKWVGAYGETSIVDYLHAQHLASWLWQTYAWSGGEVSAYRNLYQYENGVTIGGVSADLDKGYGYDYGQWRPGWVPSRPSTHVPIPNPKLVVDGELGRKTTRALKAALKFRTHAKGIVVALPVIGGPTLRALARYRPTSLAGHPTPATWTKAVVSQLQRDLNAGKF